MNKLKNRARLSVGDSFVFQGDYCTVSKMMLNGFGYVNQSKPDIKCYMTYKFYLTTPSAKGRNV